MFIFSSLEKTMLKLALLYSTLFKQRLYQFRIYLCISLRKHLVLCNSRILLKCFLSFKKDLTSTTSAYNFTMNVDKQL